MSENHSTELVKRCGRCQKIKAFSEFGFEKRRGKPRCHCFECRRRSPASPRVDIRDRIEKLCPRCKIAKPIAEYRKKGQAENRNAAIWCYCRECNRVVMREINKKKRENGQATIEYKKVYVKKRWTKLLKQYGITRDQYEELEKKQQGLCAICDKPESRMYKDVLCKMVVDHDHLSGKIRGLLCCACNIALGNFKDNISSLKKAVAYLEKDNGGAPLLLDS